MTTEDQDIMEQPEHTEGHRCIYCRYGLQQGGGSRIDVICGKGLKPGDVDIFHCPLYRED